MDDKPNFEYDLKTNNLIHFKPRPVEVDHNDAVDFDDLAFIATCFIQRAFDSMDWASYKPLAMALVDEPDAESIVKMMKQARIEVIVGG